ncbi:MAG: hypothetical protein ACLQVI_16510 [Polyangiaceae bacterium]
MRPRPPPPTRLSPLPPDLALLLSPTSTRSLLSRFSPGLALDPTNPFSVAEALSYRAIPVPLADALADVTRLATTVGREALLELLASSTTPASARALHRFPPIDLAARVVCARGLTRRQARAILKRALIRVSRHFSPRPWFTLLWPRRELPASPELLLDAARAVHGADFVRGWTTPIESGVLRAIVVYRGPAERAVTDVDGVRRVRTLRPLACDVVRWDSRDGRVAFSLARPALLTDWAAAIGGACAHEPHAFSDRPAFTLKSLHDRGDAWLAAVPLPPGVKKLEVIMCEVDDGPRFRVRSDAALSHIHERGGRARGYLRSTTIRFGVDGHDEPVDATIELPWKVLLSDGRFEEELRLAMDALEMHAPGSLPDDLPSVAPMQPEWRWVDLLTQAAFARAVAQRTLTRVRGKRPSGREHRRWGSLLRAFDMPGEDAAYVVGEELAIRAFDAKPEALVWYAIDWGRVAEVLRGAMGLAETRVTDAPAGLLPIGEIGAPSGKVIVFSLVRAVSEADVVPLLKELRRACGRATPALIVPRGRSLGGAVAEVEVSPGEQLGVEDVGWIAGRIAEECGVGDDVEPWRFATEGAPLVLSVGRGEAWYGRVRLLLTENQLAMLFALAKGKGWMKSVELGKKIAPGADHPDQIVRKARLTLAAKIEASFEAAEVRMPAGLGERIISFSRSQGYRLGVGAIAR